jgi:hypothetical protein
MQSTQVYAIERVYEDLEKPFVAKDVIKQLSQLDSIVSDIFNRLVHKVSQEKERIVSIDKRIRMCQAKVNAITERRTSNKPTTIFSTSKYPAPKCKGFLLYQLKSADLFSILPLHSYTSNKEPFP